MIRSLNDSNGFANRLKTPYTTEKFSSKYYPKQSLSVIGKCLPIRYQADYNFTRNDRYYIPSDYKQYRKKYNIENNGKTTVFKIIRFDSVAPYKAIMINEYGEVLIADAREIHELLCLNNFAPENYIKQKIIESGEEYIRFNETNDPDIFFKAYADEKVNFYPIQDDIIFGRECYISYDSQMKGSKDNDISVSKNDLRFKDSTKQEMINRDLKFKYMTDDTLKSWPQYHNIHDQSFIDTPRRPREKGIIIRSDINHASGNVIVLVIRNNKALFICEDECNIFIDTDNTEIKVKQTDLYQYIKKYNIK